MSHWTNSIIWDKVFMICVVSCRTQSITIWDSAHFSDKRPTTKNKNTIFMTTILLQIEDSSLCRRGKNLWQTNYVIILKNPNLFPRTYRGFWTTKLGDNFSPSLGTPNFETWPHIPVHITYSIMKGKSSLHIQWTLRIQLSNTINNCMLLNLTN